MTARRRRTPVRLLFLAVLVALPAQVLVRERYSEPYPGLYQPSFGGAPRSPEVARTLEPRVVVETAEGREVPVAFRELLPPTPVLQTAVFRSAFYPRGNALEPQTRAWLRGRVTAWNPRIHATAVEVTWEDVEYDVHSGDRQVISTNRVITIDVRTAP